MAAEFFDKPFFGWVLRTFDQIPIRRGERRRRRARRGAGDAPRGSLLAIAPEGAVNWEPEGDLQRIRSGVARLALPTGTPIVPGRHMGDAGRAGPDRHQLGTAVRVPGSAIAFGPPILPGRRRRRRGRRSRTARAAARPAAGAGDGSRASTSTGDRPRDAIATRGTGGSCSSCCRRATFFEGYDTFVLAFVLALVLGDLGGSEADAGWIRAITALGAVARVLRWPGRPTGSGAGACC